MKGIRLTAYHNILPLPEGLSPEVVKEPQDLNRLPWSKPIQPIGNTHRRQMRLEIAEGPGIYRSCGTAARTSLS